MKYQYILMQVSKFISRLDSKHRSSRINWRSASLCLLFAVMMESEWDANATEIKFVPVQDSAGILHTHVRPPGGVLDDGWHQAKWITGGAVAEDFNGDGWMDIYALQGGPSENLLYINQGNGTFADEALERFAGLGGWSVGAAGADFDQDGDIDIAVTRFQGPTLILINDGNGFFQSQMELPIPSTAYSMSPSWGDVDNDGWPELAVGTWSLGGRPNEQSLFLFKNTVGDLSLTEFRSEGEYLDQDVFIPRFADINNDGFQDMLVVADLNQSQVYLNRGNGVFDRITDNSGAATDENGMGSAIGDYDNDGDLDWFVSSIYDDSDNFGVMWGRTGNRMYRNDGTGHFEDVTTLAGVRDGSWGWAALFEDLDLDGDLDLYHVNGWSNADFPRTMGQFNEARARLFENNGVGTFVEVAAETGADDWRQGRGVLSLDYDNDGDMDLFIPNGQDVILDPDWRECVQGLAVCDPPQELPGSPILLRNDSPRTHGKSWLKVELSGRPPYHTHGLGTRVWVEDESGFRQMRELNASPNFLAQGPHRIAHFGVSGAQFIVEAYWSRGRIVRKRGVQSSQSVSLESPVGQINNTPAVPGVEVVLAADIPEGRQGIWKIGSTFHSVGAQYLITDSSPASAILLIRDASSNSTLYEEEHLLRVMEDGAGPELVLLHELDGGLKLSWSVGGSVTVQLESSPDLVDWAPYGAGSYTGSQNIEIQPGPGAIYFRLIRN